MQSTLIDPAAQVAPDVELGFGVRIYPNVILEAGCVVGDFCVLGHPSRGAFAGKPLVIGTGATIRSHAVIYEGSTFGPRLETGHHVVVREGTRTGENLRVGNFSDIEGDCEIGDFVRLHGYVHVGRGTKIGNFTWLFSLTTSTNDPLPPSHAALPVTIGDGCVVCVGATLMPGARLGDGAFISAGAHARGDVPRGAVITGTEGQISNHVANLMQLDVGLRHPWMRHFKDAYPERVHDRIDSLFARIRENQRTLMRPGAQRDP